MIIASLVLFLVGVGLLAAGLVSESILLEVGSIAAALLAAAVLYFGVRQRGGALADEPEASAPPPDVVPLKSTWSRSAADQADTSSGEEPEEYFRRLGRPERQEPAAEPAPAETDVEPEEPVEPLDAADAEEPLPENEPDEEAVTEADAQRVAERDDDVLVVDGRPRYHLPRCEFLGEDETVPLPVSEAREAGFTPCAGCRPDAHILRGDASHSGSGR